MAVMRTNFPNEGGETSTWNGEDAIAHATQINDNTTAVAAAQATANAAIPKPASPIAGDLLMYNGSAWVRLAKGTNGYALVATSGGLAYQLIESGGSDVSVAFGETLTPGGVWVIDDDQAALSGNVVTIQIRGVDEADMDDELVLARDELLIVALTAGGWVLYRGDGATELGELDPFSSGGGDIAAWSDVEALSGFPSTFPPTIGSGATDAVAGNDSRLTDNRTPTDGSVTTTKMAAATLVTASEGIGSNNNDTTIPTSAAVKAYADSVGSGSSGGTVDAIIAGTNIDVDATDPANPIVSVEALTADDFTDGTTNKAYTATEQTKLAGVETAADVTDATNVAAAGAIMDGDFSTNGLMKRTGAGAYATATAGTDYYAPSGTDVAVADGGTGASNASGARTNLGLVIGTDVQAYDADLTTWGGKTAPSGTVVGTTDTQTLTNKTLVDSTTTFQDNAAADRQMQFQLSAIPSATTITLTTPSESCDLVGGHTTQTLTNKTVALGSNTVSGTATQFNTACTDEDFVFQGEALGTPSSGTLTNCTGLPVGSVVGDTSTALGVGSIQLGHASDTTIARLAAGVAVVEGNPIMCLAPRVNSAASNATPALDAGYKSTVLTAQAAAITAFSLSGTFGAEQQHLIRIKDNGSARAITWTSSVIVPADGITLPTTTVVGKTHRIGCIYDEVIGKLVAWAVGTV